MTHVRPSPLTATATARPARLVAVVIAVLAVLTVEDRRQALVRSVLGGDVRGVNKGAEAADTALEMAHVLAELRAG